MVRGSLAFAGILAVMGLVIPVATAGQAAKPASPSFDCAKAAGEVQQLVCKDAGLAALDRKLADVYAKALKSWPADVASEQRAIQRGWVKGRDDCWKDGDLRVCVETAYRRRIAELQARYRLLPANGPVFFACDNNPANVVVVTFFQTEPPTLIAENGDSVSLMYQQPAASGTLYQGRNETFWEHQGEAKVTWGYGAKEMTCKPKR